MKTSVIRQRVADFLGRHPPFDTLPQPELLELAGSGKVKFHESEEYILRQGDPKGRLVWTIQQGRVELIEETPAGERLRDVLGEGDLLALEQFAGDGTCLYSARTATDVILYAVDADLFAAAAGRHPALKRFLLAHSSVSGDLGFHRTSWLEADPPPLDFLRARLSVLRTDASTCDAAALLAASRSGVAALVDVAGRPIGTITPLDFLASPTGAARPCPPTLGPPIATRAAMRTLLQSRTDHIAITLDGTPDSALEAILTSSDLALFCGHDPARLVHSIRQAASPAEISPLLRQATLLVRGALAQPQDVDDCCCIGAAWIAALAEACMRLAGDDVRAAGIEPARVPHCWIMFGPSARGDLLEPELPAIAAVYDDSDGAFHPEDSFYFAAVAGETASRFHHLGLGGAGLDWPEGARPSMPLSEWQRLFTETFRNPLSHDLYARRDFFDQSLISGDPALLRHLQDHILHELRDHEIAIGLLANDTLCHVPPLTFFRGLAMAMDGSESDSFDIAGALITPIASAARVFALSQRRLANANTLARLEAAPADFPEGVDVFRQAADAFRIGLYYQTLAGGPRIHTRKLGKFDHLLLKTALSSIQRFLEFTVSTFVPDLV